jgi:hypothetical protein
MKQQLTCSMATGMRILAVICLCVIFPQFGFAQQGQAAQSLDGLEAPHQTEQVTPSAKKKATLRMPSKKQKHEAKIQLPLFPSFGSQSGDWVSPMQKIHAKIAADPEQTHGRMWPWALIIGGAVLTLLWGILLLATISTTAYQAFSILMILTISFSPFAILGLAMVIAGIVTLLE